MFDTSMFGRLLRLDVAAAGWMSGVPAAFEDRLQVQLVRSQVALLAKAGLSPRP